MICEICENPVVEYIGKRIEYYNDSYKTIHIFYCSVCDKYYEYGKIRDMCYKLMREIQ